MNETTNTQTVANPVPEKFKEQLSMMPPSQAAKVTAQLELTPGTDSTVYKIVEAHDGSYTVLYKTYAQSTEARMALKVKEDAAGKVLPIAKAKLGSEYCAGEYNTETGVCSGSKETFTIGKLVEFQATGLIVVMVVIIGLCLLTYAMSFIMAKLGLTKAPAPKAAPAAAPAPAPAPAPVSNLDPNAPSIHPGLTNAQFQALIGVACQAALEGTEDQIHPGLTNAQLAMIFAVAAAEVLGEPCNVVSFRPVNNDNLAWVAQGRANLHSNGLK